MKARLKVHQNGTTGVKLDKQLLAEVDKKLGDKIKGGRPEILRYVLQCYWYVARVLDVCSDVFFAGRTTRGWGDLPAAAVKDPAMLEQEMAKLNGNEDEANFTAFLELADVGANAVRSLLSPHCCVTRNTASGLYTEQGEYSTHRNGYVPQESSIGTRSEHQEARETYPCAGAPSRVVQLAQCSPSSSVQGLHHVFTVTETCTSLFVACRVRKKAVCS